MDVTSRCSMGRGSKLSQDTSAADFFSESPSASDSSSRFTVAGEETNVHGSRAIILGRGSDFKNSSHSSSSSPESSAIPSSTGFA